MGIKELQLYKYFVFIIFVRSYLLVYTHECVQMAIIRRERNTRQWKLSEFKSKSSFIVSLQQGEGIILISSLGLAKLER